jgi:FAS-associated factor 2
LEANQRKERLLQLKLELKDKIPVEPDIGDPNATKLVIKLPNGTRLERRFLKTQSIKYLYYFVFCSDESLLNFQIRTNFPTRDLPGKPPSLEDFPPNKDINESIEEVKEAPTFDQCDLGKGAMLFVHDFEA